MKINHEMTVRAPIETVWGALTEIDKIKIWSPATVSDEAVSVGEVCVGFESKLKIREGGKVVEYRSEITTWKPCLSLGMELYGKALGRNPMKIDYELVEGDGTVLVKYEMSWVPSGVMLWLMSPIISHISRKNVVTENAALKRLVEQI